MRYCSASADMLHLARSPKFQAPAQAPRARSTASCCPPLSWRLSASLGPASHGRRIRAGALGLQEYSRQMSDLYSDSGSSRAEALSEHNDSQASFFAANKSVMSGEIPPEVADRIAGAISLIPGLGPDSRVLDICSGGTHVANALKECGVQDILAVDSRQGAIEAMLEGAEDDTQAGSLGNDLALRTWEGDVTELPDFQGSADAVVFCGSLGSMHDTRAALLRSMLLLKHGGHVLICEPLGRTWQNAASQADPKHMPWEVPDRAQLEQAVRDLSLDVVSVTDDGEGCYTALLQVPPLRAFAKAPLYLEGDVTTGFGRGSKQMGVPTANLPPEPLADKIGDLPAGVYFGWAQLQTGEGADGEVHKMVMNIGYRPTCEDGAGLTVEIHALHSYGEDFYGEPLKAVAVGYIRPEMRFNGLDALVARIRADIGQAKALLDEAELAEYSRDTFFRAP